MMEPQFSDEPLFELQVDYDAGNKFNEATRWAKFMSIICFICIGFGVIAIAFGSAALTMVFSTYWPGVETIGGMIIAVIVIVLIIFTYITILLYRFATLVKQGIETQNQGVFNEGLKNLKNYFLINGIFALLGIVFNAIGLLGKIF
ncbi:hypothetical protein [Paraflavitalea soli]|nr:hypothetical protein [Paraflavitalea soli]